MPQRAAFAIVALPPAAGVAASLDEPWKLLPRLGTQSPAINFRDRNPRSPASTGRVAGSLIQLSLAFTPVESEWRIPRLAPASSAASSPAARAAARSRYAWDE